MRVPKTVVVLALVVACAEFVLRGPLRFLERDNRSLDFDGPYVAARAWVHGHNPYDAQVFLAEWTASGGNVRPDADDYNWRTAYPLPTLVLLAPFVPLRWDAAAAASAVVASLSVLVAIAALAMLVPAARRAWFVILALMFEPLHTGINTGNPAAVAAACTALGVSIVAGGAPTVGGLALGLAVCVKPTIGAVVVVYYAFVGRWRVAVAAVLCVAAILSVGALRLRLVGAPWLADYAQNNAILFSGGADAIEGATHGENGGAAHQFVNLQYAGWLAFQNQAAADYFALGAGAVLGLAWLGLMARRRRDDLLALSALATISLLPVYHRAYDAGLLLLPLAWLVGHRRGDMRPLGAVVLILFVPFVLPIATGLEWLTDMRHVPAWVLDRWWWRALVVPHQAWALFVMAIALLFALGRSAAVPLEARPPVA